MEKIIEGSKELINDARQKLLDKTGEYFGNKNFIKVHEGNEWQRKNVKNYSRIYPVGAKKWNIRNLDY